MNLYLVGTVVQLETKMDQVEPVGSSVCSQSSNNAVYGNHVAAQVSGELILSNFV